MRNNGISCEYLMQEVFCDWLKQKDLVFKDEVRVKEVHRIADFLIVKNKSRLINVEAKCHNFDSMIKQLDDHAKYCDYSFAYIPDYCFTPQWIKATLIKKGYGLIVFNYENNTVTEVLEAHHNVPKEKELRKKYIQLLKEYHHGN